MGCCGSSSKNADGVVDPSKGPKAGPKPTPPSADVISKKVAQAKTTRVLALRECALKQLPASATGADHATLRTADLSSNQLAKLPDTIGAWTNLQNLLCGQNFLDELPASIGQLGAVSKIVLSDNRLKTLPIELSSLGKLKTLSLDGNLLGQGVAMKTFSPEVFGNALCYCLEELDLSGNQFEEVPQTIARLSRLKRLTLANNRLKALPGELGKLTELEYLDASENRLTFLPDGLLTGMCSLSELWLKNNPMDRLQLQKMDGFEDFMERRRQRLDAKIDANVVGRVNLAVCGLE